MPWHYLGICHAECRIGHFAQRPIDGLMRAVGYGLGLFLCTNVHQTSYLLSLGRDNLRHQLLLRVDEVRLQLGAVT